MPFLTGVATALLIALSCLGVGRAALAVLGLRAKLEPDEQGPIAFVIGVGILGWLAFFPALFGLITPPYLLALVTPGLAGLLLAAPRLVQPVRPTFDPWIVAGIVALAVIAILDLAQAAAPPADADTLAYHFALPKQFLREGHLVFVPRALDGAVPLLLHMTYLVALGIGGESALTVWVMILGWAAGWLFYAVARQFLGARTALALLLLFLTTPAVVFGAGSGQIELKLSLFATTALLALMRGARSGDPRFAALAGLAAGFYLGAKATGLIFAGLCGIGFLVGKDRLRLAAIYGAAALAAGVQWYLWNYVEAGDPIFPALFNLLGAKHGYWSAASQAFLNADYFAIESPAPRNLLWLILYPFAATLDPLYEAWDGGRTGFGPLALLLLPFALAGLWQHRRHALASPWAIPAAIILGFYVVWYLSGVSQRLRHLLPLYPFFLIALAVAARSCAERLRLQAPIGAALALTLAVQAGGTAIFARNYLHHLLSGETRAAFLERNVARYAPVPWINANLSSTDRILVTERQLVYHLGIPSYTAQPALQHRVDLLPGSSDPHRFLEQLRALGITHILLFPSLADAASGERFYQAEQLAAYVLALRAAGCAEAIHGAIAVAPRSRTLPSLDVNEVSSDVVRIDADRCRL